MTDFNLEKLKGRKIYYVSNKIDAVVEAEVCGKCVDKYDHLHFIVFSDKPELDFEAIKYTEHIYFNREDAEKHLKEVKTK